MKAHDNLQVTPCDTNGFCYNIEESDYKDKLLKLWELKNLGELCDVTIIKGHSIIYAHSCILAVSSPVLLAKLTSLASDDWSVNKPLIVKLPQLISCETDSSLNCMKCFKNIIDSMYCMDITPDPMHLDHFMKLFDYFKQGAYDKSKKLEKPSGMDCGLLKENGYVEKLKRKKVSHPENTSFSKTFIGNTGSILPASEVACEISSCLTENGKLMDNHVDSIKAKCELVADKSMSTASPSSFSTGEFNCIKCKLKFECFRLFSYHKKLFHKKNFMCLSCDFTTTKLPFMVYHLLNMEHTETYCSICLFKASDNDSLKSHLQDHKSDFPFKCYDCGHAFRGRTTWLRHAIVHNQGSKSFKCSKCYESFTSRGALNVHLLIHKDVHLDVCDTCGYTSPDKILFEHHIEKHKTRKKKQYSCPVTPCSFSTPYKHNLKDHLKTHSTGKDLKSFVCKLCSLKFSSENNLTRHKKTLHSDPSDFFECCRCNYKTARLDKAKIHCKSTHLNDSEALIHILNQNNKRKSNKCPNSLFLKNRSDKTSKNESYANGDEKNVPDKTVLQSNNINISSNSSNSDSCASNEKNTFILSETTGEFQIITEGEAISVASVTSTNVLTIGNFRKGTGSVTLNETTGVLTFNNINSESTGAVFLNESTGELSYINLAKDSLPMDIDNTDNKANTKEHTQLNEYTGEMFTVCNDDITDFNDDDGIFDSFDMDIGNEDSCDGFDDLDGLLFDPIDLEDKDIFLSKSQDTKLTEIPHLNEMTGELSFDHVENQTSDEIWTSKCSVEKQASNAIEEEVYTLLNEVTGELVTENTHSSH